MDIAPQRVWPDDADGDVFRRLDAASFDFEREVDIDFNIDFDTWPPSPELMETLTQRFATVEAYVPGASGEGHVRVVRRAMLSYELAMSMQDSLTKLAAPHGGLCESWGVLQD
ncbi:ribonuclease E inhibitor RraB [Pseudoduganella sp. SL102]|uniref:ribonuclease E inhibitor RraB n=1 Tax=Pseudoduganella sp. SL102 TaxID=2995154 RepID=UPI00248BCB12|nr:ribonuclease E inhibitor RraB [Pseudoduganella sp. SL102]WBS05573.1 ribonuclease E inhibitor RraB [Pseudoduganella sp. SL102]